MTVALPDITYFVNLFIFLLMFVSPIGFRTDMVPEQLRMTLYLNPIFYMTQTFRATLQVYAENGTGKIALGTPREVLFVVPPIAN